MHRFDVMQELSEVDSELRRFRAESRPRRAGLPREVREILTCIHDNLFDSELTVKELKSRCRIRDNNISCRFRYVMGVTIKEYVERLRMEAAGKLLRQRRLGVFDIAQSVGYYHPQTFYRAFQRRFECTPAAYRKHSGAYGELSAVGSCAAGGTSLAAGAQLPN